MGCGLCAVWCPVQGISGVKRSIYHIDPARCLECGVCGRLCAYKAVLDPEGQQASWRRQSLWLRPVWNYDLCTRCGTCVQVCPVKCIHLAEAGNDQGIPASYPYLFDSSACVGCEFCARDCLVQGVLCCIKHEQKI